MVEGSLFYGVADFTKGSISQKLGLTGTFASGSSTITGVNEIYLTGLTSGLTIRSSVENAIPANTTIVSITGDEIEMSNSSSYDGYGSFVVGLTSGNYVLKNSKLIDTNLVYTVSDIPDYQIGSSGGLDVSPFAIYTPIITPEENPTVGFYEKYIITKVLFRSVADRTFTAIVTYAGGTSESNSVNRINSTYTAVPIVQLTPNGLLPPILDYRSFDYLKLPFGQPFNSEILNVLDSGGLGIKDVYSQGVQVVGGTTGIPYANSINFIDGPDDQQEYIDAYIDPQSPSGVGNVIVSVKTPGLQSSTITYDPSKSVGEKAGSSSVPLTRTLSGESDRLVPSLVRIDYSFQDVTAINGTNYIGNNGSISYTPITGTTFSIPFQVKFISGIQEDLYFNINYTVNDASTGRAIFSNPDTGATGFTATSLITIYDQDKVSVSGFKFNSSGVTIYEPKLGSLGSTGSSSNFYAVPVMFTKTQTGTLDPTAGQVNLNLDTSSSTAVRGQDYAIYRNGSVSGATSWVMQYDAYGEDPQNPVYLVPLRNPATYDSSSIVKFNITGPTASGQAGITFPASVISPSDYTFTIKNADITTVSTFAFTQASYSAIPEGQTGAIVVRRSVSPYNNYPNNDVNVNYWQPSSNVSVGVQILNTSTAVLGTDYNNQIEVFSQQSGGSPVQTINYSTTNPGTITFTAGSDPLANPVFTEDRWLRIRTISNGTPEPVGTDRTIYFGATGATGVIGGLTRSQLGPIVNTNTFISDPSEWGVSTFSLSVDKASVNEPKQGDADSFVKFTVTRSNQSGKVSIGSISVHYKIEGITAIEGTDYQVVGSAEGDLQFASNDSTKEIQVKILPQITPAPDESDVSFKMTLTSATYQTPDQSGLANIQTPTKTVTILDTFDELDYNRTVLLIHGGSTQFPLVSDLTAPNATYTLPTGGAPNYPSSYITSSLSEVMTVMKTIGPPYFPSITEVTLPKGKTIPQLASISTTTLPWSATTVIPGFGSISDFYYFAIPTNEEDAAYTSLYYPQNLALMNPTYLLNSAGQPTRAINTNGQGKAFTLGGKGYKLYKTGDTQSSAAKTYKFG